MKTYRTSDLARAVGIHPNTVRRYEGWGLVPPVQRSANGYRRYTQKHLDCLRLAHLIFSKVTRYQQFARPGWPSSPLPSPTIGAARWRRLMRFKTLVNAERAQAELAVALLERWALGAAADATQQPLRIGQISALLGVTIDVLRNWERNGLIRRAAQHEEPVSPVQRRRDQPSARDLTLSRAGYSLMAILR